MSCAIEDARQAPRPLEFRRYADLHPDGRALIRGWHERAVARRADDSFESFIYLWIAFNSWAACVTGSDADQEWQRGHGSGGVYANFPDPELSDPARAYYGSNLDRLQVVKRNYDPDGVFHSGPAGSLLGAEVRTGWRTRP